MHEVASRFLDEKLPWLFSIQILERLLATERVYAVPLTDDGEFEVIE